MNMLGQRFAFHLTGAWASSLPQAPEPVPSCVHVTPTSVANRVALIK